MKPVNQKAWLLILPVVICVAFSAILPLMTVVNYSVQDIISPERRVFVGTEWFKSVMRDEELIEALIARGFRIAVESNGTLPATAGIDWLCISPKAGTEVVQRSGDELKLVWPQQGIDPETVEGWAFANRLLQPMDDARGAANVEAAIALVMERPQWRLSLQTHKMLGIP